MRLLLGMLLLVCTACMQSNQIQLTDLKVEHLDHPLGMDASNPRFSWKFEKSAPLTIQDQYEIFLSTDSLKLLNKEGIIWSKHGKSTTNLITYDGDSLKPFTKYYWGVSVVGASGQKSPLNISSFETGMMGTKQWEGEWITDNEDVDLKPAPYFRKEFGLEKNVVKARAYIVAAGLYELYINGSKVGDHRLDPVYTRFDKRNTYVTYDVTEYIKENQVAIGVLLGNGWYNHQSTAVWLFDRAKWRKRPRFCLNIRITFDDGTTKLLTTDKTWKTSLAPVVFNSIYTGEHYNANLEQKGWNTVNFDDQLWKPSLEVEAPSNNIVSQSIPPIRTVKVLQPVSMKKMSDKRYIFDLGQNISGITKLRISGDKESIVQVTHSEQLDSVGNLDLSNINMHYRPEDTLDPFQTDIYILSGAGDQVFAPKFNYKGFQYVEVKSSTPVVLEKDDLSGLFMHTDVRPLGEIHSSNKLLNSIWKATNNSYCSNLFGYPTDCPQREKNGWTGDAHINIQTGLYNYDGITVYEKWMKDHMDEQQPNGVLPSIIPTWGGWGYDWGNGPDWTSTITIIPWELYQFYGDDHALKMMYEPMKKYVDYISSISYGGGLTDWGLGDWVPVKSVTPKELTSSIYYYVDASILAKAAKHFGRQDDFEKYTSLSRQIKKAINDKYLDPTTGIYGKGFQTEQSAPLYWGIVPDSLVEKVTKGLVDAVEKADNHIDVGLLGTRTILGALSQNGYADLAYKVASQVTYPSWGWWIKNGATTLYENWDIHATADISKNHIMFGAIGGWLYSGLGGILPDPEDPGFKHIILKPNIVAGLDQFEAKFQSPQGEIVSRWETDADGTILYQARIPSNSTATLFLDVDTVKFQGDTLSFSEVFTKELSPGTYIFEVKR